MLTTDADRPLYDNPVAVHISQIIREMNIYGEDEDNKPEIEEEEEIVREERSGYCLPESYDGPSYNQGYPQ
jgi:hypothetical protein